MRRFFSAVTLSGLLLAGGSAYAGTLGGQVPKHPYTSVATQESSQEQSPQTGGDNQVKELTPEELDAYLKALDEKSAEQSTFTGEVTVEGIVQQATEAALLEKRRQAPEISDAISKEEMSKSAGSNAADVMQRVTGVSVQDGKYIYVRGLGERYANTTLNGARIPSTEFERKVVPFDLFPASFLENIWVAKSYTVDKPGDFAAGYVNLETLDFPQQQVAKISYSLGSNSLTSGKTFSRYGNGLSWGGAGGQTLPAGFPDDKLIRLSPITGVGFTPSELQEYGRQLVGTWRGTSGTIATPWGGAEFTAPINTGYSLSYGNTFGRFGLLLSGTHSEEFTSTQQERNFYRYSDLSESGVALENNFSVYDDTEKVKNGMVANLSVRLSDNHKIKLRSLNNTTSQASARLHDGYFSDLASDIREYQVDYKQQDVQNLQLSGEHRLPISSLGSILEWRASHSRANTEQNTRFTLYGAKNDKFILTDNSSSGFMFYNELEDEVTDAGLDWSTFFQGKKAFATIKAGVATTTSDRTFDGRRLRFKHRKTTNFDMTRPPEELFTEENIRPDGFELEETTRPTDNYTARQNIDAAYAQFDWDLNRWRVIGGVRYEASDIDVSTVDIYRPDREPETSVLRDKDYFPALSVIYRLGGNQNIRLSGSRTINRPEFRELAPFTFTDAVGYFERRGNPDLVSSHIDSYDLRWEYFPTKNDLVAVSLFAKKFDKPIESVIVEATTQRETWINTDAAENRGVELELRKSINPLNLTAIMNYAYIDSEISIPQGGIMTNLNRQMVGQPNHLGNISLDWQHPRWGTNLRILYNYAGEKVAIAGAYGLPDVMEEPRQNIGVVLAQDFRLFNTDLTIKLSGSNLTDEKWRFTQAGQPYHTWKPGIETSISVGIGF